MGGAERYNYISYFKQEATEDCLMEVSRLNLVGMKYDSDDMEVEYSVDNPNSYTLDRGALADEVGQAGWTVKHYAIYKDALTIDAFWTVEAKSDAGLISPEMDLSKDNGKFRVKLRACAEYLPAYEREIYHQAQSVRVKAEGDQFSGATFLESSFSDLQKVGFCPLTNGVNDAKLNVSGATVSLAGNNIVVNNPQKAAVALYTLDGMLVASDNSCAEVVTLPVAAHGKYVVKVGKQSVKLVF